MIVLGISAIDCESAVAIVDCGNLIWAASEERFTRCKQQAGFPFLALDRALHDTGLSLADIDAVAYPFLGRWGEIGAQINCLTHNLRDECFSKHANTVGDATITEKIIHLGRYARSVTHQACLKQHTYHHQLMHGLQRFSTQRHHPRQYLQHKLHWIPHHLAHATSAFYHCGTPQELKNQKAQSTQCLVVVMDGAGSGDCTTIWLGENNRPLKLLHAIKPPHSLGVMYGIVTQQLGYRPNRHEGKILGLAAYGSPSAVRDEILQHVSLGEGTYQFHAPLSWHHLVRKQMLHYPIEDIAAGYQAALEHITTHVVQHYVHQLGIERIALAGGVTSNVKLNQRIADIDGINHIFIFPAMADPGTGYGAALAYTEQALATHAVPAHPLAKTSCTLSPKRLQHLYLGPSYSNDEILQAMQEAELHGIHAPSLTDHYAAALLAQGFVVARFQGAMEFGPRALCHRSILAQATDPSINHTLNQRLKRTEFMPFAPVTLSEYGDLCYRNLDRGRYAAEFMTLTFDCTDLMKQMCPAAVHVDGTARPQLVRAETNPRMHALLSAYHRITGIPTLINTSFNMHEEPIVCSPSDAIRGFIAGQLDFLQMGDHIIPHPENERAAACLTSLLHIKNPAA